MMYNEALAATRVVFMRFDLIIEFVEKFSIGALCLCVQLGTDVVQDAKNTWNFNFLYIFFRKFYASEIAKLKLTSQHKIILTCLSSIALIYTYNLPTFLTRWIFVLNQLTDDFVVEILDRRPFDAFLHVFFLQLQLILQPRKYQAN